jgi:alcohol dehydrogenase class IV
MRRDFTWHDGERVIRFGRGALDDAEALLGEGYALVTTERALGQAPRLAERARSVHRIGPGDVGDLAGDLLDEVDAALVVALGGGRVVDTAKAIAAARGTRAGAVPTTLSAAEMTWLHRRARGAPDGTGQARASVVLNDPALSASQPARDLAASAANSLAHAVDGVATTRASPVPILTAREAVRLTAAAYAEPGSPDRDALALAALLSGSVIDSTWYGLHHVCAQTARAVGGTGHGPANAALLPRTAALLRERAPRELAALDEAAGMAVEQLAWRLAGLAGAERLRDVGVGEDRLEACARAAARRDELALTPPVATEGELLELFRRSW